MFEAGSPTVDHILNGPDRSSGTNPPLMCLPHIVLLPIPRTHIQALLGIALLTAAPSAAQPGVLDPSFNTTGYTLFPSGLPHYADMDVALAANGDLYVCATTVLAGNLRIEVAHLFADGTLDTGFGTDGFTYIGQGFETRATDIAIAPDGGILIAGYTLIQDFNDGFICKLLPTGPLDQDFGDSGVKIVDTGSDEKFYALLSEPGGRIVTAGAIADADGFFMRFDANGMADPGFGLNGLARCPVFEEPDFLVGLGALPDGGYVGCGLVFPDSSQLGMLARVDAEGGFVPGFGSGGAVMLTLPGTALLNIAGVAVGSDAFYIGGGAFISPTERDMVIAKFNLDGTPFTSYGEAGVVRIDLNPNESVRGIALQNGRVVVCGESGDGGFSATPDFTVARLTGSGALDVSFGTAPGYTTSLISGFGTWPFDLGLMPDGRIVLAGGFGTVGAQGFAAARYLSDGLFASVDYPSAPAAGLRPFPQPSTDGLFHLRTDTRIPAGTPLRVLDHTGRVVLEQRSTGLEPGSSALLDARALAAGSYRLHIGPAVFGSPLVIAR